MPMNARWRGVRRSADRRDWPVPKTGVCGAGPACNICQPLALLCGGMVCTGTPPHPHHQHIAGMCCTAGDLGTRATGAQCSSTSRQQETIAEGMSLPVRPRQNRLNVWSVKWKLTKRELKTCCWRNNKP